MLQSWARSPSSQALEAGLVRHVQEARSKSQQRQLKLL